MSASSPPQLKPPPPTTTCSRNAPVMHAVIAPTATIPVKHPPQQSSALSSGAAAAAAAAEARGGTTKSEIPPPGFVEDRACHGPVREQHTPCSARAFAARLAVSVALKAGMAYKAGQQRSRGGGGGRRCTQLFDQISHYEQPSTPTATRRVRFVFHPRRTK